MTTEDRLTDALVNGDPDVARTAYQALAAWMALPRRIQSAYPLEARRLARRAAKALAALTRLPDPPGR